MYEDSIICKRAFCFTDVNEDGLIFEHVDPNMFWCSLSRQSPYVEDGDAAVRLLRMSVAEIIDRFHTQLKEKELS